MENETIWAAGLAARLRLLQVDCADAPVATRQEFFTEEIGRALKSIPAEKRAPYLNALSDKFPAWGAEGGVPNSPESSSPVDLTPEELVERLKQAAPQLSEERKQKLTRQLAEAGFAAQSSDSTPWEIPADIQTKLGAGQGTRIPPENALRLLVLLRQEYLKLDNFTWEAWLQLVPRSTLKRDASGSDFKSASERYLSGELGAELAPCQQGMEKTRKMIAGLLAAIALGGKEFSEEYMVRFLPKNIEDVVHSRGVSLFGDSVEKKCWAKYKELAYNDPGTVEKKFRDSIAKHAEEIAKKA